MSSHIESCMKVPFPCEEENPQGQRALQPKEAKGRAAEVNSFTYC